MIMYVKTFEKQKLIYKLFNIFREEKIEGRAFLFLPINNNSSKRKIKKVFDKLGKYLYNNNIKNIILEESLMQNELAKNILYSFNVNILDGTVLSRYLAYNVVEKIYEYKNSKIEVGEITVLANENDDLTINTIIKLAQKVKRLNIITRNIKKFRKIVDYLYNELGILIKLSNNMKTNLRSTEIIVNIDFPEETISNLEIPNNAVVLNIPKNINITSKKFAGINIKSWEIEIPDKYKIDNFDKNILYEASLYQRPAIKAFEQIKNDSIKIKKLIGVNGVINPAEFNKST